MKYIAIIDADEKPVSCEFIGCNGNVTPYLIGTTTDIKALEIEPCEDCISRKEAESLLRCGCAYEIWNLSSVQPIRPKGEWIYIGQSEATGLKICKCSECHKRTYGSLDFCGNCGADMRGEEK